MRPSADPIDPSYRRLPNRRGCHPRFHAALAAAALLALAGCGAPEAPPGEPSAIAPRPIDLRKEAPRPLFGADLAAETASNVPAKRGPMAPTAPSGQSGPAVPDADGAPILTAGAAPAASAEPTGSGSGETLEEPPPQRVAAPEIRPAEYGAPAFSSSSTTVTGLAARPSVPRPAPVDLPPRPAAPKAGGPEPKAPAFPAEPSREARGPEAAAPAECGPVGTYGAAASALPRPPDEGSASLEANFQDCLRKYNELGARPASDEFSAIERSDLQARLIALFFLRDGRHLEEYRDIIRSFKDNEPVNVEVELLLAALYQRIGQQDLRDRALERVGQATSHTVSGLRLVGLAFAQEIRGYRSYTPMASQDFAAGEKLLVYGEIEGFKSTPVSRPAGAPAYRRSFSAEVILRSSTGETLDRFEILKAGQAQEVVEDPARPVHFWGRYAPPARLAPGEYRLDLEIRDLEGQRKASGRIGFRLH